MIKAAKSLTTKKNQVINTHITQPLYDKNQNICYLIIKIRFGCGMSACDRTKCPHKSQFQLNQCDLSWKQRYVENRSCIVIVPLFSLVISIQIKLAPKWIYIAIVIISLAALGGSTICDWDMHHVMVLPTCTSPDWSLVVFVLDLTWDGASGTGQKQRRNGVWL